MTDECKAIVDFLDCDYEFFSEGKSQKEIVHRFNELTKQGKKDGFYPLIIIASDTLVEKLGVFTKDSDGENTPEGIAAYRQKIIENAMEIDGETFLSSRLNKVLESLDEEEEDDLFGEFASSESLNTLMLAYDSEGESIIAKIPAQNPWELAAWIPMGGFNECPSPSEQVAVFRYWYEKYGAVPAVVAFDTWEMTSVKAPLSEEESEALAKDHFAFCEDSVFQGSETINELASLLKNSTVWFFWWD